MKAGCGGKKAASRTVNQAPDAAGSNSLNPFRYDSEQLALWDPQSFDEAGNIALLRNLLPVTFTSVFTNEGP
jgi:hypothetical protein